MCNVLQKNGSLHTWPALRGPTDTLPGFATPEHILFNLTSQPEHS